MNAPMSLCFDLNLHNWWRDFMVGVLIVWVGVNMILRFFIRAKRVIGAMPHFLA